VDLALQFEDLVVAKGLVPPDAFARAKLVQAETGDAFDAVLMRLGLLSEDVLARSAAEAAGTPLLRDGDLPEAPPLLEGVPPRFLRSARAVPVAVGESGVDIAVADPFDTYVPRALAFALGRPVRALVARSSDIEAALDRAFGPLAADAEDVDAAADEADLERLKDMTSDAPVVRMVNGLITRAAELGASDIHLEPTDSGLKVRYRVDGALSEEQSLPAQMRAPLVSRIKVMANLNIAERRLPQDGRLRLPVRGRDIDLRVATSPTIHGESVVLRLLDRSNLQLDFDQLGFDAEVKAAFRAALQRPHGIVLVTGPTGSGKTTTLYTALTELNSPDRKILTIEDPIEYRLAGVSQTQVNPGIGLDFAAALRSFLRQDPDVMMVGEIRDLETAQVAVQAALTGHALLSTLHTNSAASAVTRLLDMGVEPFLITSTVNAVLAQRLVRRLCEACRVPYEATPEMLLSLDLDTGWSGRTFHHAGGCAACGGAGYRGRLAVVELLSLGEDVGRLVLGCADAREIQRAAVERGMRTMTADGLGKAMAGLTTVEEVLRVTRED
jgi:general secretion pathway protein E